MAYHAPHDDLRFEVATCNERVSLFYSSLVYIHIEKDSITFFALLHNATDLSKFSSTTTRFAVFSFLTKFGFVRISRNHVINMSYYLSKSKTHLITLSVPLAKRLTFFLGRGYRKKFKALLYGQKTEV